MATPGDPFDTEERDQLRSEQRRLMRTLDDWLVITAGKVMRAFSIREGADQGLLEDVIRREASRMINADARTIERLSSQHETATLQVFLNSNRGYDGPFGDNPLTEWRASVFATPIAPEDIDDDAVGRIRGLVVLLLWADLLAADGYEDPRPIVLGGS